MSESTEAELAAFEQAQARLRAEQRAIEERLALRGALQASTVRLLQTHPNVPAQAPVAAPFRPGSSGASVLAVAALPLKAVGGAAAAAHRGRREAPAGARGAPRRSAFAPSDDDSDNDAAVVSKPAGGGAATARAAGPAAGGVVADGDAGPHTSRAALLRRYFDAMSEFPDYQQRRSQRLNSVRPFSFEQREQQRAKSASTRRFEAENERRERELAAMRNAQFAATPVPPGTFVRKYETMVAEWAARKVDARNAAEAKARRMAEAARPGAEFANAHAQAKAALGPTARARATHTRPTPAPFRARPVPASVAAPRWDALRAAEFERAERVRERAAALLALAARPPRMEAASCAQSGGRGSTAGRRAASAASSDDGFGGGNASDAAFAELRRRNPNFTFQPQPRTGVPDYEYLWARDRVALAQRRRQRPATTVEAFDLTAPVSTHAAIATDIRRDESRLPETRWPFLASREKVRPTPPPAPRGASADAGGADGAGGAALSRATKATEAKAAAAFGAIVAAQARENGERSGAAERAARQRAVNRRVAPFLAALAGGAAGAAGGAEAAAADIERRVREKKAELRRRNAEARRALAALEARVRGQPPLFVEPGHLAGANRQRAATEEAVAALLRENGLGGRTLNAVVGAAVRRDAGAPAALPAGATRVVAADVETSGAARPADGTAATRVDEAALVAPHSGVAQATKTTAAAAPPPKASSRKSSSSSSSSSSAASSSNSSSASSSSGSD